MVFDRNRNCVDDLLKGRFDSTSRGHDSYVIRVLIETEHNRTTTAAPSNIADSWNMNEQKRF